MQVKIDASEKRSEFLSPISAIAVAILVFGMSWERQPKHVGSLYPRFPKENDPDLCQHTALSALLGTPRHKHHRTALRGMCAENENPGLSYSEDQSSQNCGRCASNHLASCTTGTANRNLGPVEGVRSLVFAFSESDIVDARSLRRNKVLFPSISIRALDRDSGHITSHASIRHHRAIVVCRNRTHGSTPSVALLAAEAPICWDGQSPAPCSTAGCKAREDLDCHSAQSCCKCL